LPFVSPKIVVGVAGFLFASYKQNECHEYLATLRKYTLPDEGLFQYLICPHYTCECLVYLSMAVAGAPGGQVLNRTVLCGALFVAVNLGATAAGTKQWYIQKFGADKLAGRWRMIPYIF
jgi:3-oxo-5-alpha-steroid 4-dehydrogenase 3 / polyprenol reductase